MREPLYRLNLDASTLLAKHPPRLHHPHKAALCEIAYPDCKASPGEIVVTRWPQHIADPITLPKSIDSEVRPDYYDYAPVGISGACAEWHVNFADPRLFGAYGSGLFAQDEMQVVEHPLLGCVREALLARELVANTSDEKGATPILVQNVERRIHVATNVDAAAGRPTGLYGNRFAAAPFETVRRATRRIDPPSYSNIIAMAAPAGGHGDYTERQIEQIFTTAYTAFEAAHQESIRAVGPSGTTLIHTGFWGCGAFGGNRKLMVAMQSLAARAANVTRLILHAGDISGIEDAQRGLDVADQLASRCGMNCSLDTLVGRAEMLAYRWGVSDGN